MPLMQCWCFWCAGRPVPQSTFYNHGAIDTPRKPLEAPVMSMVSSSPCPAAAPADEGTGCDIDVDNVHSESDSDAEGPEEIAANFFGFPGMDGNDGEAGDSTEPLSPQELLLYLLDWMSAHKVADAPVHNLWDVLKSQLHGSADLPTFHSLKKVLQKAQEGLCQRIECCPIACVAFWCVHNTHGRGHLRAHHTHARTLGHTNNMQGLHASDTAVQACTQVPCTQPRRARLA